MVTAGRGGPFVKSALLCEKVLHERDGVLSYVRVVDRVVRTDQRPDAPEGLAPFQHSLVAALSFVSGDARGRHTVTLELEPPSGLKKSLATVDLQFEGGHKSAAIAAQFESDDRYGGCALDPCVAGWGAGVADSVGGGVPAQAGWGVVRGLVDRLWQKGWGRWYVEVRRTRVVHRP